MVGIYATRRDRVNEYSVIPSANPGDHFLPSEVLMATSAGVERIQELHCATSIPLGSLKALVFGSNHSPHTLIMAVEQVFSMWICSSTFMKCFFCLVLSPKDIILQRIQVENDCNLHTEMNCFFFNCSAEMDAVYSRGNNHQIFLSLRTL